MKLQGLVWLGCAAASSFKELTINATHIQQIMVDSPQVIQYWTSAVHGSKFTAEESPSSKDLDNVWIYMMNEFHVRGLSFAVSPVNDPYLQEQYTHVLPDADGMVTLNFTVRDDMKSDETNDYSGSAKWPESWVNTIVDAWRTVKGAMSHNNDPRPA